MPNLVSHVRSLNTPARAQRGSYAAFDPLDVFRNFYSPTALEAMGAQTFGGVEISRTDNGYRVEIPVAGYKPEQIEITYKDDVLSVAGKSETRSFTRSLLLPDEIDSDDVGATVEHGMLTLTLERRPEVQPKKIAIRAN